jgi:hypothetical protein
MKNTFTQPPSIDDRLRQHHQRLRPSMGMFEACSTITTQREAVVSLPAGVCYKVLHR